MPTSQRAGWTAVENSVLLLVLSCHGIGSATAMATPMYPDINFHRQPDLIDRSSAEVQQSAKTLSRPCLSHNAVSWHSAKPLEDLRLLSEDLMHNLPAFTDLLEIAASPPSANTQRLYTGKLLKDEFAFTFLWRAGQSEVSLQICSAQPLTAKDRFTYCAGSAPSVAHPLTVCPASQNR